MDRRQFLLGAIVVPMGAALPAQAIEQVIERAKPGESAPVPKLEPVVVGIDAAHAAYADRSMRGRSTREVDLVLREVG
jgi:hypothetical protein